MTLTSYPHNTQNRGDSYLYDSHCIRYYGTVYEASNKNWFWSIKNSGEVISKLKCRGFRATSLSTYDFSTQYTTLPHYLIKEKLLDLIEWTFKRALKIMDHFTWPVMTDKLFSLPLTKVDIQNRCDALSYLLDNMYIRFADRLLESRWIQIAPLS